MTRVLGLVGCAAGGLEDIRTQLIEPMQSDGWTVAVTVTPTAATWLRASGEYDKIEAVTGLPVRVEPRLPTETSPHPPVDCYAVVPATASTVAKLALGIADNQALTSVCEALGNRRPPVVIFPRINAAHAGQPAWLDHIDALRRAGAHLIYGDDVWPLHTPRSAPGRALPWNAIRRAIDTTTRAHDN
ncbi:flavoprotein [Phytoactinopolyspora halotolerans]|uniref:Flavoprotein n=1 Tax=Phytoactinopolyspora halotolerans TaxID=1981512 RepID=A0A6L9SBN8_9ACTN|nr:flavoprotein [Phytoactinopolyspora halotolerans]NEE02064.1 flavoprotein [Phytoactinopolyspora halotolerans]